MKQKKFFNSSGTLPSAVLAVVLLFSAGCGQKSAQLTADQNKAFDNAPPEVKQTWDKALAADKANDYVAAQTALSSLSQMKLSDQQQKVLEEERAAFGQRMMQAADKNDPGAIEAVKQALKNRKAR